MSRKLPGSAIVPGTITVTQITGGLNDTTNASYAQANTARTTANDAYGQANTARDQANTARTQANTAYGQANNAYSSANLAYDQANASYNVANTKLASAGGTLSGDLIITGNLTVSGNSTTLNTEILTVEDAEVVLLSNVASTPALNAGVIVNRGTSANTFLRWDEALDEWGWSDSGTTTYYFDDLRAGLATTNTTFGTINTSLGTINTSYQAAYAQANTAGTNALNAYGQANAAYGAANNRVLKAGDTMTGQLNISSGGLLVTGNVGIGTSSPSYKLSVSGTFNVTGSSYLDSAVTTYVPHTGVMGFGNATTIAKIKWGSYGRLQHTSFTNIPFLSFNAELYESDYIGSGTGTSTNFNKFRPDYALGSYGIISSINGGVAFNVGDWNSNTTLDLGVLSDHSSYAGGVFSNKNWYFSNNVGIGTASPSAKLQVEAGEVRITSAGAINTHLNYQNGGDNYISHGNAGATYFRNSSATLMTILGSGNVGIGTNSPSTRLHLYNTSGDVELRLSADGSSDPMIRLTGENNGTGEGFRLWYDNSVGDTYFDSVWSSGTATNPAIRFRTQTDTTAINAMTITHNGNVGIGTTSPSTKLHVEGTGFFTSTLTSGSAATNATRIALGSNGDIQEYFATEANPRWRIHRDLVANGKAGIGFNDTSGTIAATGCAVGVTSTAGTLAFYTTNGTSLTERMSIDNTGNVSIKQTPGKYTIDTTGGQTSIANNGTVDFPNASGLLIVNNHNNGGVTIYLCGGGNTTAVSSVIGQVGTLAYNSGVAGYTWTNNYGSTATFGFFFIRTRPTA